MRNNNLFYERLSQVIEQSGKSKNQIERELGYSRNSLHSYKTWSELSAKRLVELSQYFKLPLGYLLMGCFSKNSSNSLRSYFEQLIEDQKVEITKITQEWLDNKIIEK